MKRSLAPMKRSLQLTTQMVTGPSATLQEIERSLTEMWLILTKLELRLTAP
jgi:hypothetical protein